MTHDEAEALRQRLSKHDAMWCQHTDCVAALDKLNQLNIQTVQIEIKPANYGAFGILAPSLTAILASELVEAVRLIVMRRKQELAEAVATI